MNALEFNKIAAGLIGSFLALQLFFWAGELIYHPNTEGAIEEFEVAEADMDEVEVVEGPAFEEVILAASAADGERLWRQCSACHRLEEGANAVGPYLWGVVNRDIGSADGFSYSTAMGEHGGQWTPEALNGFLEAPSSWLPGTKMVYRGLRDVEDRANLIAYLATTNGVDVTAPAQ